MKEKTEELSEYKIKYSDIMELGFKEEHIDDEVYFDEHGYKYSIIEKKLTKRIYLDWEKDTKICTMIRLDKEKGHGTTGSMIIKGLDQLKEIIDFFK